MVSGHDARGRVAQLQRSFPAIAASIPLARAAAVEFAASVTTSAELLEAVALTASEAVTNAVLHAYPEDSRRAGAGSASAEIHLSAWVAGGELWLLIAENGCGLRSGRRHSGGLGLGLALIVQVSDGFSIHARAGGGTELRARFRLTGDAGQSRGSVAAATRPASPRFSTTK